MRFIIIGATAAAALALAACEPAAQDPAAETPAAEGATTEDATAAADATEGQAAAPAVALDGEGLRLVDRQSGSTRLIAFGTPRAEASTALAAAWGEAGETGANAECPPGPLEFAEYGETTVYFQDGAFAGWYTEDTAQSGMNGLAPGWTRAQVEEAGGELSETSLGQEFEAGGMYGIMNEDASAVSALWAGVNCFFR